MRGQIVCRERYLQSKSVDFSGLRFENNITPMDIDGSLDFKDELFFYIDFKLEGARLDTGERRHLCGQVNTKKPPAMGCVLIASHNTPVDQDIQAHSCIVTEYYWLNEWRAPKQEITVREAIELVREKFKKIDNHTKEAAYDDVEYFNERAAVLEYEAGYCREEAEKEARKMMIERCLMLNKMAA